MDQTIKELIPECMRLESERKELLMLMFLLDPPKNSVKPESCVKTVLRT